jgi:NADH-quinone oxidoreductase subunit K
MIWLPLEVKSLTEISSLLFVIGTFGIFVTRRNLIITLMSIELILLAVNINFINGSLFLDDLFGQVFALFVLTTAAAEAAIGLALLIGYYRLRDSIETIIVSTIKG